MKAGHTRCLGDGCFGLLKRKYRPSDTHCLDQLLVDVVNSSAVCNVAELVDSDRVPWYGWDAYLLALFKPLKGISKLHHYVVSENNKGFVRVSKAVGGEENDWKILKQGADLPALSSTSFRRFFSPQYCRIREPSCLKM